ncbi:unnamed protein product, partial [Darwinula stevensoni]
LLSEDDIFAISEKLPDISEKWENLGRELGIDEITLDRILQISKSRPTWTTYLLLSEWRTSSSPDRSPIFRVLHDALQRQGIQLAADLVDHYFKKESCKLLSEDDIFAISEKLPDISEKWENLGRELGLDEITLDRIMQISKSRPTWTTYLLLSEWRTSSSPDRSPTFRVLHDALQRQGIQLAADLVDHYFKKESFPGMS